MFSLNTPRSNIVAYKVVQIWRTAKKRRKAKPQIKRKQDNSPNSNTNLRKKYLKILENVCQKMNCADAYSLLTKQEKIRTFGLRAYVGKLKINKEQYYTSDALKFYENYVNDFFSELFMSIMKEKNLGLTNFEILVAGQFLKSIEDDDKERHELLMNAFQPMVEHFGDFRKVYGLVIHHYCFLSNATNLFDQQLYSIRIEGVAKMYPTPGMCYQSSLVSFAPRESYYEENGNKRAIYQLGYINNAFEMHWTFVQAKDLEGVYNGYKKFLPICIQRHAYHRLFSRLNPVKEMELVWLMNHNLQKDLKVEIYKGRVLIPFYYFESKCGYFVAIVNKNRLIIKTFLFITHHSTPEGEKLAELSGLSKEEISYWKIGSLRNFVDSDMAGNHQMKEIFEQAGVSHLFHMNLGHRYEKEGKDYNWDALTTYINCGKTELFNEGAEDPDVEEEMINLEAQE